ncbi:MAG: EamA family transporter [Bdellovibrionota bacterium]
MSFRYALAVTPVSYAVGIRQTAPLFGVLTGVVFLRETYSRPRLIGAILCCLGVILIKVF